jgi:hypothetical protein
MQFALPKIFKEIPDSYFNDFNVKLKGNADYLFEKL